jgi:hypothetical protein
MQKGAVGVGDRSESVRARECSDAEGSLGVPQVDCQHDQ